MQLFESSSGICECSSVFCRSFMGKRKRSCFLTLKSSVFSWEKKAEWERLLKCKYICQYHLNICSSAVVCSFPECLIDSCLHLETHTHNVIEQNEWIYCNIPFWLAATCNVHVITHSPRTHTCLKSLYSFIYFFSALCHKVSAYTNKHWVSHSGFTRGPLNLVYC